MGQQVWPEMPCLSPAVSVADESLIFFLKEGEPHFHPQILTSPIAPSDSQTDQPFLQFISDGKTTLVFFYPSQVSKLTPQAPPRDLDTNGPDGTQAAAQKSQQSPQRLGYLTLCHYNKSHLLK